MCTLRRVVLTSLSIQAECCSRHSMGAEIPFPPTSSPWVPCPQTQSFPSQHNIPSTAGFSGCRTSLCVFSQMRGYGVQQTAIFTVSQIPAMLGSFSIEKGAWENGRSAAGTRVWGSNKILSGNNMNPCTMIIFTVCYSNRRPILNMTEF